MTTWVGIILGTRLKPEISLDFDIWFLVQSSGVHFFGATFEEEDMGIFIQYM
jgi:hypothetical protein